MPKHGSRSISASADLQQEWNEHFKLAPHPVRCFTFDELPQLWTVVRGDIARRPPPLSGYDRSSSRWHFSQRLRVLTGLWQITVRSAYI